MARPHHSGTLCKPEWTHQVVARFNLWGVVGVGLPVVDALSRLAGEEELAGGILLALLVAHVTASAGEAKPEDGVWDHRASGSEAQE